MQADGKLAESVRHCDIVIIDGIWVSCLARVPRLRRAGASLTGIDLFHRLLGMSARRGWPVYFLVPGEESCGAPPDQRPRQSRSAIRWLSSWVFRDDERRCSTTSGAFGARGYCSSITSPMKENSVCRWNEELGVDFVMAWVLLHLMSCRGKASRAAALEASSGFEWLYRVIEEPRRCGNATSQFRIFELSRACLHRAARPAAPDSARYPERWRPHPPTAVVFLHQTYPGIPPSTAKPFTHTSSFIGFFKPKHARFLGGIIDRHLERSPQSL